MPILDDASSDKFVEPDDVPRPVVTFGATFVSKGFELEPHAHRKAQLMMSMRGVLTCEAAGGLWIVPPRCALWVPANVVHGIKVSGTLEGYSAFVDAALATPLPAACCAIPVSPLLRELVIRSASFEACYPEGGLESHLATLLIDEIAAAPIDTMQHVPMPEDARLRKVATALMDHPADRGTLETWAKHAGLSERTMARLVVRETGMSFGRWRQQIQIMYALQWLAGGMSIQQVAIDLGYESAGSFVTMFRKALGNSPGRYMAERAAGQP
ncbi:AraC family transcriptional regulator [Paraburkholderia acidisoli]|uniref:Helix-turn-helix domain-containing protein n=1 Tax=Paraburkholderia acidisoli TaxID=2571748 RepID=A0A7Z2GS06_9BURK|nr:helix-turn-helix transcriptional regulator [Paraburkholderia acidisoli]QGZ66685.1 helix-turn-helix domain-containing protein [Paraburkholderia acidisoli]